MRERAGTPQNQNPADGRPAPDQFAPEDIRGLPYQAEAVPIPKETIQQAFDVLNRYEEDFP
jgi:hypothetical protein